MIPLSKAIDIFMEVVIEDVAHGTFESMQTFLKKGSSLREKKPEDIEMNKWFLNLEDNEKRIVSRIIRETINRTIFHFLVVLDNNSPPVKGEISDFALNFQTYTDEKALFNYNPDEILRINKSFSDGVFLHDIFADLIYQEETRPKNQGYIIE